MKQLRTITLLGALAWSSCSQPLSPIERSLAWLTSQQHPDGLWRSQTYGVLRRGESTTAAIALALAKLPHTPNTPHPELLARTLRALAERRAPSAPTPPEPVDYPCFTAAHRLHALALAHPEGWRRQADELLVFLHQRQLGEAQGWPPDAPEFGSFGLGDRLPHHPDGGDLAGLAVTTAVLEAAAASGLPPTDPLFRQARTFVERCQRSDGDGGFFGAPTEDWHATKAGFERSERGEPRPRSYGTATADGVLALLALGDPLDSRRVQQALAWLDEHTGRMVPGLQYAAEATLEPSLRLYWLARLAAVARAAPAHPRAAKWRQLVLTEMSRQQSSNGRFVGLAAAMKEDDALVATALGLSALAELMAHPAVGR